MTLHRLLLAGSGLMSNRTDPAMAAAGGEDEFARKANDLWFVGVLLCLVSTMSGAIGKQLIRCKEMYRLKVLAHESDRYLKAAIAKMGADGEDAVQSVSSDDVTEDEFIGWFDDKEKENNQRFLYSSLKEEQGRGDAGECLSRALLREKLQDEQPSKTWDRTKLAAYLAAHEVEVAAPAAAGSDGGGGGDQAALLEQAQRVYAEAGAAKVARYQCTGSVLTVAGYVVNVACGPLIDMAAYAFAPQSIIAPMGGLDVVWNTLLAPLTLKETLTVKRLAGCLLVAVAAGCLSVFGEHDEPTYSVEYFEKQLVTWRTAICE
eukprot:SAG22_NODE_1219_length_5132_cov_2.957878_3_plen_318_part_00